DVGDLDHVLIGFGADHEVAIPLEIPQLARDLLPTFEDIGMSPGARPVEPGAGVPLAPDHSERHQIVEASSVDPGDTDIAALDEAVEGQPVARCCLPVRCARPAILVDGKADLNV